MSDKLTIAQRYDFKNISDKLTPSEKEIILSRATETLKTIQTANIEVFVATFIKVFDLALNLAGHKKNEDDYKNQVGAYLSQMKINVRTGMYGSLTSEELTLAVQRGMAKQYGDYMGINYATINDFILGYMQEQNEAITKQRLHEANLKWDAQQEQNAIKARKDYEKSFVGMIEADKSKKKKEPTKMVKDYGSQKFIQLQKEGTIKLTEIEVEKLKERTLLAYSAEVSEARKTVIRKRAATTGDKIKPVFRLDNEESERASKNRIFRLLAYNEFLKG